MFKQYVRLDIKLFLFHSNGTNSSPCLTGRKEGMGRALGVVSQALHHENIHMFICQKMSKSGLQQFFISMVRG